VDSPNARVTNPHSPSAMRLSTSGKPLKPMSEKDLKAAVSVLLCLDTLGIYIVDCSYLTRLRVLTTSFTFAFPQLH
jgi:hypothetical protein